MTREYSPIPTIPTTLRAGGLRTPLAQLMGSAVPTFYPDDPTPQVTENGTPPSPTPPLPVEGQTVLDEAKPAEGEPTPEGEPKPEGEAKAKPEGEPKPEGEAKPEVPETYDLKVEIDGKEVPLDPVALEAATPVFKEAGITNVQAQAVVSHYATQVLPAVAQTVQTETLRLLGMEGMGEWAAQLKADKEIGGAKYEENLTIIAQGRDAFATPELRQLMESSRLGNHPEIARLFFKLGNIVKEGSTYRGDPKPTALAPEAILYGQEYQPKT